jgi:hypothetical protein
VTPTRNQWHHKNVKHIGSVLANERARILPLFGDLFGHLPHEAADAVGDFLNEIPNRADDEATLLSSLTSSSA